MKYPWDYLKTSSKYDISYPNMIFVNFILSFCEKVLTLRPLNSKQMARQHRTILGTSNIQGLKSFEGMLCAPISSRATYLTSGYCRHVCFSSATDIS